jgi:AraC-like DNA-binding protein
MKQKGVIKMAGRYIFTQFRKNAGAIILWYARLLLEKRTFHVYEVAEMAGYSDSSSFSKAFFKRYGYRPVECILNFSKNLVCSN